MKSTAKKRRERPLVLIEEPSPTKVVVFSGRNGKYYYRKTARNGKITQGSQGYASAGGARRAAKRENPLASWKRGTA